jgi:hypothetical protein
LPQTLAGFGIHICRTLLFFINRFQVDEPTASLISKTPGLRRPVTIAWRLIYWGNDENRKRDPIIRSGLVYFFKYLDYKDPAEREEVVEGASGTVDALARLIMEYINFLIPFITTTNGEILNDILHAAPTLLRSAHPANAPVPQPSYRFVPQNRGVDI